MSISEGIPAAPGGARPCLLVLGMHRSGTSALARGLVALGASLGDDLLPPLPCNPRGFFEDQDINAVNRGLLARLGLSWSSPAPVDGSVLLELAASGTGQRALALVCDKARDVRVPAFKDPRLSRLLPFWRPIFAAAGLAPRCAIALREPRAVAASLARRDGMKPEDAHALWLRHSLDALDGSLGLPRILVAYDRLLAAPGRELRRVAHEFGLSVDAEELASFSQDFLDARLCHHKGGDEAAPPAGPMEKLAVRLYAALEPLAAAPAEALDQALEKGRLLRLRKECAQALDEVAKP